MKSNIFSLVSDALSMGGEVGGQCLGPVVLWSGGAAVLGVVVGLGLYLAAIRPLVRWSRARTDALGCLAAGFLVLGGLLGGGWCGLFIGGDQCLRQTIDDGYLLEELALKSVVELATHGHPPDNPQELAAELGNLLDSAEGSLDHLIQTVLDEIDDEHPDLEVRELLPPEIFSDLDSTLDQTGFADPENLARLYAVGGVRAALTSDDHELLAAAQRLVDSTAMVRRHVILAIDATFIPLAVLGPIVGFGGSLILIFTAVLITRLFREGDPAPTAV